MIHDIEKLLSIRRSTHSAPLLAFHGCDKSVADKLLSVGTWAPDKNWFQPSTNEFDWLGMGMYFWLDSPLRAYEWAQSQPKRGKLASAQPSLVGALINPGLCLNLMDFGVIEELRRAYVELKKIEKSANKPLPENTRRDIHGMPLLRKLDWTVIQAVHQFRSVNGAQPYDTVMGFFEEGEMAFEGSSIRAKTHVQIAVRNPNAIVGFFRVI